jgi:hypothetical protein
MISDTPIVDFLGEHRHLTVAVVAVSALISLCLIARLWVIYRSDSVLTKLVWSLVLLIPLLGWIVYGGFYHAPAASGVPASTEHSANISGVGADGHF